MCVRERDRERERKGKRERERDYVCVRGGGRGIEKEITVLSVTIGTVFPKYIPIPLKYQTIMDYIIPIHYT